MPQLDFQTYQERSRATARYPEAGANPIYPTLGLCGEAGEVADKVKKVLRDENGAFTPEVIAGWQRLWGLGFCGHPYRVPVCYVLIYGVCLTYVN